MERTEELGEKQSLRGAASKWRLAAGILILAGMVFVAFMMLPPYIDNFHLQQSLEEFVARPESLALTEDAVRLNVVERAAQLGLPLRTNQVRVDRGTSRLRVEILYAVRITLPLYTVDLHFHPAAGSR